MKWGMTELYSLKEERDRITTIYLKQLVSVFSEAAIMLVSFARMPFTFCFKGI